MRFALRFVASLLIALGALTGPAQAAVVIEGRPVTGGFEFVAGGSLDLGGLGSSVPTSQTGGIAPALPAIGLGATPGLPVATDQYLGATISGPSNFGPGDDLTAMDGTGDRFSLSPALGGFIVDVPRGYVGGDPLNATLFFAGGTIESLGLTPDTYVWKLPNDSVTLNIVSLPAALPLLATAFGGLLLWRRRTKVA